MSSQQVTQPKSARTRTLALVAAGVLAAAGITGLAVRGAAADPVLPPLTPAELLGKVAAAQVDGLSATFEQRSDLGLPSLPADLGDAGNDLSSALALLTGTHTVRVWLAEPDKAKVALVDGSTESSITRNGLDVWAWSSTKQEAVHSTLEAPTQKPSGTPTSPTTAIKDLLDKLSPTHGRGHLRHRVRRRPRRVPAGAHPEGRRQPGQPGARLRRRGALRAAGPAGDRR